MDSDYSHEIKRHMLLGRKAMTNKDSILKKQRHNFSDIIHVVKAVVSPGVMYRRESWTIKKAESLKIGAFKLWCWRKLFRVHWTARKSNQSILKEINPDYSLEGPMLKLKLQYLATWCKEPTHGKDPDAGKDWGQEKKEATEDRIVVWHHQLNGCEFEQTSGDVKDREVWHAAIHGVTKCWTWLSDWKRTGDI